MLFLSPSPPQGCPYGESLPGAFLVEVLVVNGDPRKYIYIYKVKVIPPSPPQGCPYGESLRGAFLVEVLVVNGDPRKYIYKVTGYV